jgi:hypothetical protein
VILNGIVGNSLTIKEERSLVSLNGKLPTETLTSKAYLEKGVSYQICFGNRQLEDKRCPENLSNSNALMGIRSS